MVKSLKARGIKIDGVGLQGHLIVGKTPGLADLTAMVKSFTDLDVEVAYTEIDVRYEALPPTVAQLAQQDADWSNVVLSRINVPRCVGMTIWDFTDKYSWIPGVFDGQGDILLWDADLKKKQVFYAVIKALGGTVPTSTSSSSTVSSTTTSVFSTTTSSKMATPTLIKCNRDNCLRNLVDARHSVSASAFCSTYTTTVVTATSAISTWLAGCSGLPSRVSSACTCVVTSSSSSSSTSASTTASTTSNIGPACTDD